MEEQTKKKLEERFGADLTNFVVARPRRMFVDVPREKLVDVARFVRQDLGMTHLSTITGLDAGNDQLELLYHFATKGLCLTLKVKLPVSDPKVSTITGVYLNAESYERETMDLLGTKVEGLPPGRRYPLPDEWPEGDHPLRKNWKKAA
jgi:NADH:ubiquinone oxidoreductase subunit C